MILSDFNFSFTGSGFSTTLTVSTDLTGSTGFGGSAVFSIKFFFGTKFLIIFSPTMTTAGIDNGA